MLTLAFVLGCPCRTKLQYVVLGDYAVLRTTAVPRSYNNLYFIMKHDSNNKKAFHCTLRKKYELQ